VTGHEEQGVARLLEAREDDAPRQVGGRAHDLAVHEVAEPPQRQEEGPGDHDLVEHPEDRPPRPPCKRPASQERPEQEPVGGHASAPHGGDVRGVPCEVVGVVDDDQRWRPRNPTA
jgi:hypothetical protein